MSTIYERFIDIHLFAGWSFVLLMFAIGLVCLVYKLRRRWRGIAALTSCLVVILVSAALILTWEYFGSISLSWSIGSEGFQAIAVNSLRGDLQFDLQIRKEGPVLPWPGRLGIVHRDPTGMASLFWEKTSSLLRAYPILEDQLGLQIAVVHRATQDNYSITLPQWMIFGLTPWFPLLWFHRFRRQRYRSKNGLCLNCGFDLRAHKPGDKCPECGTVIPAPKSKLPGQSTPDPSLQPTSTASETQEPNPPTAHAS